MRLSDLNCYDFDPVDARILTEGCKIDRVDAKLHSLTEDCDLD